MKYLSALLIAVLLSGCVASRINKYVARRYGNHVPARMSVHSKAITIKSAIPFNPSPLSTTAKQAKVLPLLFYWKIDNRITCTLNPGIFINTFSNNVQRIARRHLIKDLRGKQLKLTIRQLPHVFTFNDKTHIIWIIIYYLGWEKVGIYPSNTNLVVSYKLLDGGKVSQSGKIVLPNDTGASGIRYFESLKTATNEYLTHYNLNIRNMARSFVTQLEEELALQ